MQSKLMSMLESFSNLILGFIISVVIMHFIMPLYGLQADIQTSIEIVVWFTLASLFRSYVLRRLFNLLDNNVFKYFNIFKAVKYYLNPKYAIYKGINIGNRTILNFCAYPYSLEEIIKIKKKKDGYYYLEDCKKQIGFKNQEDMFWTRHEKYKAIWTFRQLLKWRRLISNGKFECLEYKWFKWKRINPDVMDNYRKNHKKAEQLEIITTDSDIKKKPNYDKDLIWIDNSFRMEDVALAFAYKIFRTTGIVLKNIKVTKMGKFSLNNEVYFWLNDYSQLEDIGYLKDGAISMTVDEVNSYEKELEKEENKEIKNILIESSLVVDVNKTVKNIVNESSLTIDVNDSGTVIEYKDGIAKVYGLKRATSGELIEFEDNEKGLVSNIYDNYVEVVILGKGDTIKSDLTCKRLNRFIPVPGVTENIDREKMRKDISKNVNPEVSFAIS